ncbi:hypothetical protein CRUP_007051 [Coryphaenoides rupestris]|nr:hypothetical protein CRUP_007051 [Coryphaenoides rupestris]
MTSRGEVGEEGVTRVISRAPGLKLVVETLMSSLKPIGNIVVICCAFFIIFGILGVQVRRWRWEFGENKRGGGERTRRRRRRRRRGGERSRGGKWRTRGGGQEHEVRGSVEEEEERRTR